MRIRPRYQQRGLSFVALIVGLVILIIIALFAMKVLPSYMEFRAAKNAIDAIAREKAGGTPNDIRRAFEARSQIDNIEAIKANDLDITKQGGNVVIGFQYRKEVPLFTGVGLYIDYTAHTGGD